MSSPLMLGLVTSVVLMVGTIKSILDGSSQDTGEITMSASMPTVLMIPVWIKVANIKKGERDKIRIEK